VDVRRVPLISGSRVVFVPVEDDDVVVRPPPPPAHAVDTRAGVRDALRFPLTGPPLPDLVPSGGRVTVVVEPPALPFPIVAADPRREALATVLDELARHGVGSERVTVVLAGGLGRRAGRRSLEQLVPPQTARGFRGRVVAHDVESPELVEVAQGEGYAIRAERALVDSDLVVVVSAAETVVHGGPATLASACDARTVRRMAGSESLLQASGTAVWRLALDVEAAIGRAAPLFGVSLVLDHPRLTGSFSGYPHDDGADDAARRSPFRRVLARLPDGARRRVLASLGRRASVAAVHGGPPSVAHAEAMLRGIELRGARLDEPVDAIVVGVPWSGLHLPLEPPNPVTAAAAALGFALRLWRDAFPVRDGGTVVLVHPFRRSFAQGSHDPYRALYSALAEPDELAAAEGRAAANEQSLAEYRSGRSCHPLLPFADWAGCVPTLRRVGRVIVAGSRDSAAARAFGFVPSHSLASALEMAHGLAGGRARIGVELGPPYPPLLVGRG
jgi:hypothetical protein